MALLRRRSVFIWWTCAVVVVVVQSLAVVVVLVSKPVSSCLYLQQRQQRRRRITTCFDSRSRVKNFLQNERIKTKTEPCCYRQVDGPNDADYSQRRRNLFRSIASVSSMVLLTNNNEGLASSYAWAVEDQQQETTLRRNKGGIRPYAPMEFLLPAARVKKVIDRSVQITTILQQQQSLSSSGLIVNDNERQQLLVSELKQLLLTKQNFLGDLAISEVPEKPAQQYLQAYQAKVDELLSPFEKTGALLVQNGEIRAWKRLKREERQKEESDEIRAALNVYTSHLEFNANRYLLNSDTISPQEKSQLIRNDQLPDIKTVIASDMGLRYLYRNNLLTAIQNAKYELEYQLKQDQSLLDVSELAPLLEEAQVACNNWFSLIDDQDIQKAMQAVENIPS